MKVVNVEKLIEVIRNSDFPKKGELHRIIEQLAFEVPIGELHSITDKDQIDMTNVYYPEPTQVIFNVDGGRRQCMSFGIAFHEYIIQLSTGRPVRIQEILRNAQNNGIDLDDAIIEYGWDRIILD